MMSDREGGGGGGGGESENKRETFDIFFEWKLPSLPNIVSWTKKFDLLRH